MQQFLNFLPLPQGQGSFLPTFCLPFGLAGQSQARHRRQAGLGLGHVSRLLAGQLFEGEQQQTRGVALKLLDPLPVFFLLGLLP